MILDVLTDFQARRPLQTFPRDFVGPETETTRMPEGHKTHYLARDHQTRFGGEMLTVTSPQGRFTDARRISGKILEKAAAAGKHLFYHFEGDLIVHVHLGRYGSFATQPSPPESPRGQVRMRWVGRSETLDLRGPTRCEIIDSTRETEIRQSLGPDPLAEGSMKTKKRLAWETIRSSSKPIGGLLLDQSVIAGAGNIFRAEVLFEIGMSPNLAGNQLTTEQFDRLWKSLTQMMRVGLKYGKIISVTAREAGKPLSRLGDRERFRIYGKSECPNCGAAVETPEIASRKIHLCPVCQAGC